MGLKLKPQNWVEPGDVCTLVTLHHGRKRKVKYLHSVAVE